MYVGPGQVNSERDILGNRYGSARYAAFLAGINNFLLGLGMHRKSGQIIQPMLYRYLCGGSWISGRITGYHKRPDIRIFKQRQTFSTTETCGFEVVVLMETQK